MPDKQPWEYDEVVTDQSAAPAAAPAAPWAGDAVVSEVDEDLKTFEDHVTRQRQKRQAEQMADGSPRFTGEMGKKMGDGSAITKLYGGKEVGAERAGILEADIQTGGQDLAIETRTLQALSKKMKTDKDALASLKSQVSTPEDAQAYNEAIRAWNERVEKYLQYQAEYNAKMDQHRKNVAEYEGSYEKAHKELMPGYQEWKILKDQIDMETARKELSLEIDAYEGGDLETIGEKAKAGAAGFVGGAIRTVGGLSQVSSLYHQSVNQTIKHAKAAGIPEWAAKAAITALAPSSGALMAETLQDMEEGVADAAMAEAEEWQPAAVRRGETIQEAINQEDFGKAAELLFYGVTGNAFSSLVAVGASIAGSPAAGSAILGASAGGQKFHEIKDREDISMFRKVANAAGSGLAEAIFERFGTGEIAERLVKGAAKGVAKDMARDTMKKRIMSGIKSVMGDAWQEGWTESATQMTENILDNFTGVGNPGLFDGVTDSFLIGFGSGAGMQVGGKALGAAGTAGKKVARDIMDAAQADPEVKVDPSGDVAIEAAEAEGAEPVDISQEELTPEQQAAIDEQEQLLKENPPEFQPETAEDVVRNIMKRHNVETVSPGMINAVKDLGGYLEARIGPGKDNNVVIDAVTGIPNSNTIRAEIEKYSSDPNKVIVFFDIDNFKAINDVFGHGVGDDILFAMGQHTKKHAGADPYGRYGGEEIMIIMDKVGAAKRVQDFIRTMKIEVNGEPVTVSGGVAAGVEKDANGNLRITADKLAYEAKEAGKNQFVVDIDGEKQYIKGTPFKEKKYVQQFDISATAAGARRLLEALPASDPRRAALEGAVQALEGKGRDGDSQRPADTDTAPAETAEEVADIAAAASPAARDLVQSRTISEIRKKLDDIFKGHEYDGDDDFDAAETQADIEYAARERNYEEVDRLLKYAQGQFKTETVSPAEPAKPSDDTGRKRKSGEIDDGRVSDSRDEPAGPDPGLVERAISSAKVAIEGKYGITVSPGTIRQAKRVSKINKETVRLYNDLFGTDVTPSKVVFVDIAKNSLAAKERTFTGAYNINMDAYVINNAATREQALHFILGHEITHHWDTKNHKLYQRLQATLRKIDPEAYQKYKANKKKAADAGHWRKEFLGNTLGEVLSNKTRLQEIGKHDAGLLDQIRKFIQKILKKITLNAAYRTSQYFKDFAKVEREITAILGQYSSRQRAKDARLNTPAARQRRLADWLMRDAMEKYNNAMEHDLLNRIDENGGIQLTKSYRGREEVKTINGHVKMRAFRKEGGKPLDEMAEALGMSDSELLTALNEYQPLAKPSQKIEDYLDEARELDEHQQAMLTEEGPEDSDNDDLSAWEGQDQVHQEWYSQMQSVLTKKLPGKGTGAQFLQAIRSWAKKGEFKQEELEWSGLEEWLQEQDRVTSDQVALWLAENNVRVKTVTKRDPGIFDNWTDQEIADEYEGVFGVSPYDATREVMIEQLVNESQVPEYMEGETKFSQYTLPGGENYQEVLLTMPSAPVDRFEAREKGSGYAVWDKQVVKFVTAVMSKDVAEQSAARQNQEQAPGFEGSHFGEDNILAHARLKDRTDSDGNKVLFIEEIQSDWHQQGRKAGYDIEKELEAVQSANPANFIIQRNGEFVDTVPAESPKQAIKKYLSKRTPLGSVPDAPFKKTWPMLAFKKILRLAAEGGYAKVAWTTGEQQADRYDLSKHVDEVSFTDKGNNRYEAYVYKGGSTIFSKNNMQVSEIESTLGKEVAEKIVNKKNGTLSGLDLKIGGEGMKTFYDNILPAAVKKYVKKWGGKVEKTALDEDFEPDPMSGSADEIDMTFHSLTITPKMNQAVLAGQMLFQDQAVTSTKAFKKWFGKSVVTGNGQAGGTPLVVYHGGPKGITEFKHDYDPDEEKYYFTTSRRIANDYHNTRSGRSKNHKTYRVYLKIEDLWEYDAEGESWGDIQGDMWDAIESGRNAGADGVVIRNVIDNAGPKTAGIVADTYVVFNNKNIKSATDNVGTYDPKNPDIRFQDQHPLQNDAEQQRIQKKINELTYRIRAAEKKGKDSPYLNSTRLELEKLKKDRAEYVKRRLMQFAKDIGLTAFANNKVAEIVDNAKNFGDMRRGFKKMNKLQLTRKGQAGRGEIPTTKKRKDIPPQEGQNRKKQLADIYQEAAKTRKMRRGLKGMYDRAMEKIWGDEKIRPKSKAKALAQILAPVSTQVEAINPKLKYDKVFGLRGFTYNKQMGILRDTERALPFMEKFHTLPKGDQKVLDIALKNADQEKAVEVMKKHGMLDSFAKLRVLLDDIRNRALDAGYNVKYVENYFPRQVMNATGFMDYLYEHSDDFGVIDEAIKKQETVLGRPLSDAEAASVINSFIGRSDRNVESPGNIQEREIDIIDTEMDKYYDYAPNALVKYITNMNHAISMQKFLGNAVNAENPNLIDIDKGIGEYLTRLRQDGVLDRSGQDELLGILKAHFGFQPTARAAKWFKATGYAVTMGSGFSSFLSQLGDLAWAMNESIRDTPVAFAKALAGRSKIKMESLGVDRISAEFEKTDKADKFLEKLFKVTLLEKMDRVGKETLINTTRRAFQRQAKRNSAALMKKLERVFGDEAARVMQDLAAGKDTENTTYLFFNKLLDHQPAALSEMPQKYLDSPNGRIFYMLKTFTLKQLDIVRRDALWGIKNAETRQEKIAAYAKLMKLVTLFVLANTGADALKDLIFWRKPSLSDYVFDNIFRLMGLSRFLTWEARRNGVGAAFSKLVTPPLNMIEYPFKDIKTLIKAIDTGKLHGEKFKWIDYVKTLESWQNFPIFGKHYHWYWGAGRTRINRRKAKENKRGSGRRRTRSRAR